MHLSSEVCVLWFRLSLLRFLLVDGIDADELMECALE